MIKKTIFLLAFLMCFANISFAGEQKVFIQVWFSEPVSVKGQIIVFSDALKYTPEEYAKLTQADIDVKKAERVNNWKYVVEHPVIVPEPTKEQLQAEVAAIDEQKSALDLKRAELMNKINPVPIEEEIIEE